MHLSAFMAALCIYIGAHALSTYNLQCLCVSFKGYKFIWGSLITHSVDSWFCGTAHRDTRSQKRVDLTWMPFCLQQFYALFTSEVDTHKVLHWFTLDMTALILSLFWYTAHARSVHANIDSYWHSLPCPCVLLSDCYFSSLCVFMFSTLSYN